MDKTEFLIKLSDALCDLPEGEREKACSYYSGMIDAKMSDGKTEEEAVASLGETDSAALAFLKQSYNAKRTRHPIVALRAVLPALFMLLGLAVIWAVLLSLYAAVIALGAAGVAGILGGIAAAFLKTVPIGLCFIGAGLIALSFMLMLYYPVNVFMHFALKLSGGCADKMRSLFAKEALSV